MVTFCGRDGAHRPGLTKRRKRYIHQRAWCSEAAGSCQTFSGYQRDPRQDLSDQKAKGNPQRAVEPLRAPSLRSAPGCKHAPPPVDARTNAATEERFWSQLGGERRRKPSFAAHESNNETGGVPTVWRECFDGRSLTFSDASRHIRCSFAHVHNAVL